MAERDFHVAFWFGRLAVFLTLSLPSTLKAFGLALFLFGEYLHTRFWGPGRIHKEVSRRHEFAFIGETALHTTALFGRW